MRYWFLCLAILTTNAGVTEGEVKSYNETTDRCSIEAELIALERGWVELRSADGRAISVPLSELSKADQRYVRDHVAQQKSWAQRSSADDSSRSRKAPSTRSTQRHRSHCTARPRTG